MTSGANKVTVARNIEWNKPECHMHTLATAAKATGKSRTAIWRAIKSGKISYKKDIDGHIQIDPAELHRVYPAVTRDDTGNVTPEQNEQPSNTAQLTRELEILKAERERERGQLQAMIDQLSRRLDEEATERRKLTALLTHQQQPAAPETARPGFWRRLFGG